MSTIRRQRLFLRIPAAGRQGIFSIFVCALLMAVSCSSEESSSQIDEKSAAVDSSDVDREPGTQSATTDKAATDSAESEAGADAESAFRTMTMENPDPAEWNAAYQELLKIGAPALPVLLEGLKSESQTTRDMASSVLAEFGEKAEPSAAELVAALDDESIFVRANVATALLQMPDYADRVVPVFVQILESEDAELRRTAATNLTSVETENLKPFIPQLVAALDNSERDVVLSGAQILGRIGPEASEALPKLQTIEAEDDEELQAAITTAIHQIDPDRQPE